MSLIEEYMEKSIFLLDNFLSEDEEEKLLSELDVIWFAMTEKERDLAEDKVKDYSNSKRGK